MINFTLIPINFVPIDLVCEVIEVDVNNFEYHKNNIIELIDSFNSEIRWDDMFNINDVNKRIIHGQRLFIGYSKNIPFGYVWFDDNTLYNLYVRNNLPNKNYSGKGFVSKVVKTYYADRIINCEVDEWNVKSIKLFKRLGFNLNL